MTYSQNLEDSHEFETEYKTTLGKPDGGNRYVASAFELEYGVRSWWSAELYLDSQLTANESALYTGFRLESRFRPIKREHLVNPLLYIEYENISAADKTILEVVGHDVEPDLALPNESSSRTHQHEGELKLILSSNFKSWNISENFISEKNLGHAPWEFGYAVGVTRPLRAMAGGRECEFCLDKFVVGMETYGGLGDTSSLSLRNTSHYIAPLLGWQLPKGLRLSLSPGVGWTYESLDTVYRVGVAFAPNDMKNWIHGIRPGGRVY